MGTVIQFPTERAAPHHEKLDAWARQQGLSADILALPVIRIERDFFSAPTCFDHQMCRCWLDPMLEARLQAAASLPTD